MANFKNTTQKFDGMALPPFPPLIADAKGRFEAIRDMDTRDDDVILVAFPKAGTHWTWEVLNMLVQGKADYNKKSKVSVFIEAIPDLNVLENIDSPRVLNTHAPFRWLPQKLIKNGGKLVHVMRNPKDVAVSAYHHLKSSGEVGPGSENMTWSDFFKFFHMGPVKMYGGWFAYEKEMEEAKRTGKITSVHTLHYEDMKKDPHKEIRRLAEYLGVECSDELVNAIADKTSFKKLKEASETSNRETADIMGVIKDEPTGKIANMKPPKIYRKGQVGDWKNYYTVAQNEQYDALYAEEMKNVDIKMTYE